MRGQAMTSGVIFKRCGCRDTGGQRREQRCPRLGERGHGSWYFHASATNVLGRSERIRRGGFAPQAAARRARDQWLAATEAQRTASGWTVERWLRHWLDQHTAIRPTTRTHYTGDVERVLIPHLGQYRLADLDARLLRTVFDRIAATTNAKRRPQSASAMQHLRTTLRAALNLAVKNALIETNPARHITVTGYRKPHAQVWTDDRVHAWQQTGEHPPVAVWTAHHLGEFLDSAVDGALFAFWWLTALRGLRVARCAVCDGPRSTSNAACCTSNTIAPPPATRSSKVTRRPPPAVAPSHWTPTLSGSCASTGTANPSSRRAARRPARSGSTPGTCLSPRTAHPSTPATPAAASGCSCAGPACPPSGCTTLRHGAASLAQETCADLKTLQDLLGHSSVVVTADTYTSVLPQVQRRCADATAKLGQAVRHSHRSDAVIGRHLRAAAHGLRADRRELRLAAEKHPVAADQYIGPPAAVLRSLLDHGFVPAGLGGAGDPLFQRLLLVALARGGVLGAVDVPGLARTVLVLA